MSSTTFLMSSALSASALSTLGVPLLSLLWSTGPVPLGLSLTGSSPTSPRSGPFCWFSASFFFWSSVRFALGSPALGSTGVGAFFTSGSFLATAGFFTTLGDGVLDWPESSAARPLPFTASREKRCTCFSSPVRSS